MKNFFTVYISNNFFFVLFYRFYMDKYSIIGDPSTHIKDSSLDLLELELRFFGGTTTDDLDNDVSHVLVDKQ